MFFPFIFVFISWGRQRRDGDLQTLDSFEATKYESKENMFQRSETIKYCFFLRVQEIIYTMSVMFKWCRITKHAALYSWWLHLRKEHKFPSNTVTPRDCSYTKIIPMLWANYLKMNLNHSYSIINVFVAWQSV